jgi:YD repeat-containing protein
VNKLTLHCSHLLISSMFAYLLRFSIKSFWAFSLLASFQQAVAQDNQAAFATGVSSVLQPAPNAASLGKFTEVPISLYTGLPTTTIPIWLIKQGDLTVNVALNYHSGGIKVDEIASWVGLGWALDAGGVITRSSRGLPDDIVQFRQFDGPRINRFVQGQMSSAERRSFINGIYRGSYDSEPDLYSLSVGGISCRFFIGENSEFVVMPRDLNMRIQYGVRENGVNYAWIVTDAHGIRYKFRDSDSDHSITNVSSQTVGQSPSDATYYEGDTSWNLTQMEDSKGNSITFTYAPESGHYLNKNGESISVPISVGGNCGSGIVRSYTMADNATRSQRLTAITCGQEEIRFIADPTPRLDLPGSYGLQTIEVRYANEVKKRFLLTKSYVSSDPTGVRGGILIMPEDYKRLFLNSFQEEAGDGSLSIPAYKFTYNERALPPRNSLAQDHWGYYNGKDNDVGVSYLFGTQRAGANKDPDPLYTISGTLTNIRYPTGGEISFTYEANRYLLNTSPTTIQVDSIFATSDVNADQTDYNFYASTEFEITQDLGTVDMALEVHVSGPAEGSYGGGTYNAVSYVHRLGSTTGINFTLINGQRRAQLPPGKYVLESSIYKDIVDITVSLYSKLYATVNTTQYPRELNGPGLRIKQITKHFAEAVTETRTYEYLDPTTGKSSAQLSNFPDYKVTKQVFSQYDNPVFTESYSCLYNIFSSHSNYPLINTKASYTGYSYVTEYLDAAKESGKKTYSYTNYNENNDINSSPTFPFVPNSPQDWKRGLLLKEETYKAASITSNQLFIKQKVDSSTYTVLPNSEYQTRGVKIGAQININYPVSEDILASTLTVNSYLLISDSYQLREKVVTAYEPQKVFQSSTSYRYTLDTFQPNKIATRNSDNSRIVQRLYYPTDYRTTAGSSSLLTGMLAANLINLPIEQTTRHETRDGGDHFVSGIAHAYASLPGINGKLRYYIQQFYALNTTRADTTQHYDFLNLPAHYDSKSRITQVNSHSEPVSYMLNGISSSSVAYQWGYDDRYPLAECKHATATEFYYQGFEEDVTATAGIAHTGERFHNGPYTLNWVRPNARSYLLSYWYRQGNIWHWKQQSYSNSLALSGGDAYDDIRIQPTDALLTTYTYLPLLGLTSQTDSTGRTIFYEYDALGRLVRTRDEQGHILSQQQYHYARP